MKAILIAAWSHCLLSLVAAAAICWRFLGVREGGLVEIAAMQLATMVMVAGLTLAFAVTGIVRALRGSLGHQVFAVGQTHAE
jgi:hypothetical protein